MLHGRLTTVASNSYNIAEAVQNADLVIGGVLIKGARAPRLVTREMVSTMRQGSVIADVAVDQGGCVETIHATTHSDPTYIVDGDVYKRQVYAFTGAAARTSGQEKTQGMIASGKLADLTIFDRDPFAAPAEELLETRIAATIVDGVFRHRTL